jgi:hypothetical protein
MQALPYYGGKYYGGKYYGGKYYGGKGVVLWVL